MRRRWPYFAILGLVAVLAADLASAQVAPLNASGLATRSDKPLSSFLLGPADGVRARPLSVPASIAYELTRGSTRKYALWGGAIGGAIGLAIGIAAYNNSRCTDCWVPNEAIPPYGFVLGAATGVLVGLLVHAMAAESSTSER